MTKRVVLIGHPVAHSLSGAMQQAAFDDHESGNEGSGPGEAEVERFSATAGPLRIRYPRPGEGFAGSD
jgi:hypothetical protein